MFYQILRSLREKDGLSQTRFAQEIGFSQAAISAWENNTREPGIDALLKIARYFNISVDYLVGNASSIPSNFKVKKESRSMDETELFALFNLLPSDLQRRVLTYTKNLCEINKAEQNAYKGRN